jgi:hypothetical protein
MVVHVAQAHNIAHPGGPKAQGCSILIPKERHTMRCQPKTSFSSSDFYTNWYDTACWKGMAQTSGPNLFPAHVGVICIHSLFHKHVKTGDFLLNSNVATPCPLCQRRPHNLRQVQDRHDHDKVKPPFTMLRWWFGYPLGLVFYDQHLISIFTRQLFWVEGICRQSIVSSPVHLASNHAQSLFKKCK